MNNNPSNPNSHPFPSVKRTLVSHSARQTLSMLDGAGAYSANSSLLGFFSDWIDPWRDDDPTGPNGAQGDAWTIMDCIDS